MGRTQKFLQFLNVISPILVVIIGSYFTHKLSETERMIHRNELELKRIDAARELMDELFSGTPERAFIAERLIINVISDDNLSEEISSIVDKYYALTLESLIRDENYSSVDQIAEAAVLLRPHKVITIQDKNTPAWHVIVFSSLSSEKSIEYAHNLRNNGFPSDVYLTGNGYYAVTLGQYPIETAKRKRDTAIELGVADSTSWLSKGSTWLNRIFPQELDG